MSTKTVGILGGMGPDATIKLYEHIVRCTKAEKDQDHIPLLIYNLPSVPDRSKAILNIGAGVAVEDTLKNAIKKLTERADKIDENKNKIATTLNNLQDQAIKLSSQIEEKYQALQEAQLQDQSENDNLRPPNVS